MPPRAPGETPPVLGLFQKRFEGDDALLRLAALRFRQANLAPEFHASSPEELDGLLGFLPEKSPFAIVHLRREIDLMEPEGRLETAGFASRAGGRIAGVVVHDQPAAAERPDEYVSALEKLESELQSVGGINYVFIEYAAMMEPRAFTGIFSRIEGLPHISACVDTGHIGLFAARRAHGMRHPGQDVCGLSPGDPELPDVVEDVEEAVGSALPAVLDTIKSLGKALGKTEKPVHFHLHDGHPLMSLSPHGLSDHLSFLGDIPLPFEHKGRRSLGPMFGPRGLSAIVGAALDSFGTRRVSFTLEIHPDGERLALGADAGIFGHWSDLTNAEKTNRWLDVLAKNRALLAEAIERHS